MPVIRNNGPRLPTPTKTTGNTTPVAPKPAVVTRPTTTPTRPTVIPGPVVPGPKPSPSQPLPGMADFAPPTFDLTVPDGLGRPPTSADISVRKGLDGRTPEQATELVLGQINNPIDARNRSFAEESIRNAYKMVTIGVNNVFTPNSPHQRFLAGFPNAKVSVVGTMSSVCPSLLKVTVPGKEPVYYRRGPGGFEAMPKMTYPVVMEAELRAKPMGVKLTYPRWSAPVLAGPTATILEGGPR